MNDIAELVAIIKQYGGSATIEEIIKQYVKNHPIWIQPEHRAMMEQTLREHPELVTYDEEGEIWDLKPELVKTQVPQGGKQLGLERAKGTNPKASLYNAAVDWMEEKLASGEIADVFHTGNQWQAFITPNLKKALPSAKDGSGAAKSGYSIYYEINIDVSRAYVYLMCNKDNASIQSIEVMTKKIIPTFKDTNTIFSHTKREKMDSLKITSETTPQNIIDLCNRAFAKIKAYEEKHPELW